jgi:hypothetical protein
MAWSCRSGPRCRVPFVSPGTHDAHYGNRATSGGTSQAVIGVPVPHAHDHSHDAHHDFNWAFAIRTLLNIALTSALLLAWTPNAGIAKDDGKCEGLVQVGYGDQSIIIDNLGNFVCKFQTHSRAGRQILTECPDGSLCSVSLPLKNDPGAIIDHDSFWTIVDVRNVERIRP